MARPFRRGEAAGKFFKKISGCRKPFAHIRRLIYIRFNLLLFMSAKLLTATLAIGGSLGLSAQGAADLSAFLATQNDYAANASFEVLLPQAEDPVVYDIVLNSNAAPGDSLSVCDYVISWTTQTPSGPMSGFSAYYNSNHYRYRNNRLQEYHATASILPFLPQGPGSESRGVQNTAQFVDLLPQSLGARLHEIATDSSYVYAFHPDTLVSGKKAIVVDGAKRGNGYDVSLFSYVFDKESRLPLYTEIISSPGSISEQTINVTYNPESTFRIKSINEEALMDMWPDVFEKFRESTFKAENLVGAPLPAFSSQILGGTERMSHHSGQQLDHPAIFVFLDPDVTTSQATVDAIREAASCAPLDVDIIWVFSGNDSNAASSLTGNTRHGETTLMSARSLVRDCGVTLYPTVIIADRKAIVKDVTPGFNNDMPTVVLQKVMLIE